MKTILFLGGSSQQVVAIKKAKDMGFFTILIDYLKDNPGQYIADRWYAESTTDIDKVYKIAKLERVNGILPYASDPAAIPAAIASEKLALPSNPTHSIKILGSKHLFRDFLKNNGFATPGKFSFPTSLPLETIRKGIKNLKFPILIKPTDSSGSKGISLLNNIEGIIDAINYADIHSKNKLLIAEEYISHGYPYIIGGDILVENGIITIFGAMDCLRCKNGNSLIPIGKKFPSGLNPIQKELILKELQLLINKLGIKNLELNIEVILDKNNKPYIIEMGPRAGGNMIPILLSDALNIDLVKKNIDMSLGNNTPTNAVITPYKHYMTYIIHSEISGILESISFSPTLKRHIYREILYKRKGDKIDAFLNASYALGIIFMRFDTKEMMLNIEKRIKDLIKIKIRDGV